MFLVYRKGVYMQGIVGVFSTKGRALTAKLKAKERETDDWHEFEIMDVMLNELRDVESYYE